MELDFNKILKGEDQLAPKKQAPKNLTKTQARQRQQSCMIKDVDKDLLPENTNVNPTGFRVSLSDMLQIDKNDQSLQSYKKALLGNIKEEQLKEDEAAEVEILKVQIVCPDRPGGAIELDFKNTKSNAPRFFQIKQGCIYCMRIHFMVKYDIVVGLKFVNNVYKLLAKVDKDEQKMGSFAPQKQPHTFDLPWVEAPSGFLARGQYKGKGLFLDNEGIVHCQFDYVMKIDSKW